MKKVELGDGEPSPPLETSNYWRREHIEGAKCESGAAQEVSPPSREPLTSKMSDEQLQRVGMTRTAHERISRSMNTLFDCADNWKIRAEKAEGDTQEERQFKEIRLMDADMMAVTNCEKLRVCRETRAQWQDRAKKAEGDTRELKAALEEARIKLLQHLTPSPEGHFRRPKAEDVDWYLQFEAKVRRLLG
jgi:hypothetical protein